MGVLDIRRLAVSLTILAAIVASERAPAEGPAYLVKDVEGSDPQVASDPHGFVALGGVVLFTARDDSHGFELWRTDGQPDGTAMVAELAPSSLDGVRDNVRGNARAVHDGALYFLGSGGIWRSDGTAAGTTLLANIAGTDLVADDEALYVFGADEVLWRIGYDGTATRLAEFPDNQIATSLTLVGERLFFTVNRAVEELWTSDGTAAGTRLVRAVQVSNREGGNDRTALIAVGSQLFFAADHQGWELWRSDGTSEGTRLVRDINPGDANGLHFNDYSEMAQPFFAAVGDTLFFLADDGVSGLELWRSDGTADGTRRVVELAPGTLGIDGTSGGDERSDVAQITIRMLPAAGRLFFTARPTGTALELWESDGTAAGTHAIARLTDDWGWPDGAAAGDRLYISVGSHRTGSRLWTSDGTAAGTVSVPVPYGYAAELTPALGGVVFAAGDESAGFEPWISDGTTAGTQRLADIARGRAGLNPTGLTNFRGTLFFSGRDAEHGEELWRSDGTDAGTVLVADILPGRASSNPGELVPSGSTLYFNAGGELWASDGSASGTRRLLDLATAGYPDEMVADGRGGIYFFASQPQTGYELWHSDGTAAGTHLVREIRPGPDGGAYTRQPTMLGDLLLFSADDGEHGAELWRSDGSAAGTVQVADLQPGAAWSDPQLFTVLGDVALFFGRADGDRSALFRTDGTTAGTVRLAEVGLPIDSPAVGDGRILFAAQSISGTDQWGQLWQSDGTAAGTFRVHRRRFGYAGVASAGTGLFALVPGPEGELLRIDCGALRQFPDALATLAGLGDRMLFGGPFEVGRDAQLWTSDGTAGGTDIVQTLPASPDDGRYHDDVTPDFTRAGDLVFFAGDFGGSGRELWALPVAALPVVDAPPCPPSPTPTARSTPGAFACPDGGARCTAVEIDTVEAEAGDAATITATLHALDAPIAGIQNDLAFPDGVAVAARDGDPDCTVEPSIGKNGASFSFQPFGCEPGVSCLGMRALVLALDNVDPIPDGSPLYTCTVQVSPDARPGAYPLTLSNLGASDPDGVAEPLLGIDGAIVVTDSGSRPATGSTSASSSGCQTASATAPATALPLLLLALLWWRRRA